MMSESEAKAIDETVVLKATLAAYREALRPFAAALKGNYHEQPDNFAIVSGTHAEDMRWHTCVGDWRRAHKVYTLNPLASEDTVPVGQQLLSSCRWLLEQIETGTLVRDISQDGAQGWAGNMMEFVLGLQRAQQTVLAAEGKL